MIFYIIGECVPDESIEDFELNNEGEGMCKPESLRLSLMTTKNYVTLFIKKTFFQRLHFSTPFCKFVFILFSLLDFRFLKSWASPAFIRLIIAFNTILHNITALSVFATSDENDESFN